MSKKIYSLLAALLTLTGFVSSCSDNEDLVFDHERQMFETRADRILLEYIAPFGTTADEEVYIIGPFNGNSLTPNEEGKYDTPNLDEAFRLVKAEQSNAKWGIYLDPATFVGGKTLADGFRFYSVTQGHELELAQTAVYAVHYDNPGLGTFTNVWGQRWESYFWSADGPTVEHDGFTVYVIDETGWNEIFLYQWGDVNNLNGDWPGVAPTGKQTIDGVEYKYWDMGADNEGLNQNLIFNNNEGTQLPDFAYTIDHDVYLRVTAGGVEELEVEPSVKHDGYALFVLNESSETDLALYAWGSSEAFGGWPGMAPTGTQTINGLEYVYFDLGEANTGAELHLIPNNNNNGVQWEGDELFFTIDHDIYIRIWDGSKTSFEVIDKNYQGGGENPEPQPEPQPEPVVATVFVAVKNNIGFADPHLYVYGDGEALGGWPGAAPVKVTENGWNLFELPADGNYTLIVNDNGASQIDGPAINTAGTKFFDVTTNGWVESTNTVTIVDNVGYADPHLYAWGDGEIYGGWRGITPTSNSDGTLVFPLPNDGGAYNLIINGGDGTQQDVANVLADQSYTFTLNKP